MLTSVKGIYKNGTIILDEKANVADNTEVVVTFLEQIVEKKNYAVKLGGPLKGKVTIPDNFNDPLEELNEYMY